MVVYAVLRPNHICHNVFSPQVSDPDKKSCGRIVFVTYMFVFNSFFPTESLRFHGYSLLQKTELQNGEIIYKSKSIRAQESKIATRAKDYKNKIQE